MNDVRVLHSNELLICPHCAKPSEDPVGDWVIPGRVGAASRTTGECDHCGESIRVECLDGNKGYRVEAA